MLLFLVGFAVGMSLVIVVYHVSVWRQLKKWGVDWRARAISAEQEVENWKVWAKVKGHDVPFSK